MFANPNSLSRAEHDAAKRHAGLAPAMLVALAGIAAAVPAAHAETVYKWNDSGLTTYQDRAPDSGQDNGHAILNHQGVVLEEVLSREERRAQRARVREEELARIRDRALLATFTTEADLIRTRDDRIGMIDGLISRLDDRIRILSERLAVVDKRVQMQEKSSGEGQAQETLYAEQKSIQRNIENAWSLIDSKAEERNELAVKFEDDLVRYRELKEERWR
ncbi:MAG: hypothetical protein CSB44_08420 [Gammaproteobacteria bacterium]|nr:MAG: hypothetical protein CSB44_08420 [Gammaproteobacteria bacterium]